MELPTKKQINPFNCLDGQVAEKNWYGLTVEQGAALLARNPIHYQEDLMWMGLGALRYYTGSILLFIQSDECSHDDLFVHCILGTMEFRLKEILKTDRTPFIEILNVIETNWSRFYSAEDERMSEEDRAKLKNIRAELMGAGAE